MDPTNPGDETLKLIAENYGIPGMVLFALVVLLAFLSLGLPRLITAIRGKDRKTPEPPQSRASVPPQPTKTFWEGISATMVQREKAKQDETQDERLNRIEERIDEVFKVEGKHRHEVLDLIKEVKAQLTRLDDKFEKERDKNDRKNEQQDNLISGLGTSFATLQGMIAQRRRDGGSGTTLFEPKAKPKDDE